MDLYIHQLISREISTIQSLKNQLSRARSILEIVHINQHNPNNLVRFDPSVKSAQNQLKHAAEFKINELLEKQFKDIKSNSEDKKKEFAKYERQHWQILRGNFPNQYHKVMRFKTELS